MTKYYVLTKSAKADIRDITRYTVMNWGEAQCRTYITELEKTTEAVAKGEGAFKDMGFILPDLRMATCGKHYIFCMPQAGKQSIILAILHERMNLMARLKNRL